LVLFFEFVYLGTPLSPPLSGGIERLFYSSGMVFCFYVFIENRRSLLEQFFLLALGGGDFFEMFVGHRRCDTSAWGALDESGLN
jgi:hypothetical protein